MPGPRSLRWIALVACGAFTALGCSTDDAPGETGALSLDLVLNDDIEIDEVRWEITGGDMEPMFGTINTSAVGATASVEVFGIPEGDDYLITMEATATDGRTKCKGSAPFDVRAGLTTRTYVMLNCTRPTRFGGVRVNGEFNICAELTKVVVSPLQTSVGNEIDLSSTATDVEGDTITYLWTSKRPQITVPTASTTTYTCTAPGDDDITIAVTDDGGEHCFSSWTVRVTCVSDGGGTGGTGGRVAMQVREVKAVLAAKAAPGASAALVVKAAPGALAGRRSAPPMMTAPRTPMSARSTSACREPASTKTSSPATRATTTASATGPATASDASMPATATTTTINARSRPATTTSARSKT